MQLPTAGLLVIQDRKLLLAFSKNKQCFYLPGGKIGSGETARSALCREINEELAISLEESDLEYYTHISAPAWGEKPGTVMEQDCFFITKTARPEASAEIGELRYFSLEDYSRQTSVAPGVVMVMERLRLDGLID